MGGNSWISRGFSSLQGGPEGGIRAVPPAMEPWVLLDPRQKALYLDVMHESYETLMSLGKDTPEISFSLLFIPLSFPYSKRSSLARGVEGSGQVFRGIFPSSSPFFNSFSSGRCY